MGQAFRGFREGINLTTLPIKTRPWLAGTARLWFTSPGWLARQLACPHMGRENEEVTRHLFQKPSILLMKGNERFPRL